MDEMMSKLCEATQRKSLSTKTHAPNGHPTQRSSFFFVKIRTQRVSASWIGQIFQWPYIQIVGGMSVRCI